MNTVDEKIDWLMENYTLEEILELSDISPEEALRLLFLGGHIDFPIDEYNDPEDYEED